jgi:hypothetical protein
MELVLAAEDKWIILALCVYPLTVLTMCLGGVPFASVIHTSSSSTSLRFTNPLDNVMLAISYQLPHHSTSGNESKPNTPLRRRRLFLSTTLSILALGGEINLKAQILRPQKAVELDLVAQNTIRPVGGNLLVADAADAVLWTGGRTDADELPEENQRAAVVEEAELVDLFASCEGQLLFQRLAVRSYWHMLAQEDGRTDLCRTGR